MSSSGGNAGLAAAYCAQELGLPITVVVPRTTPDFIVQKIKDEGATVEVVGKVRRRMCGLLSSLDAARFRMSYHRGCLLCPCDVVQGDGGNVQS